MIQLAIIGRRSTLSGPVVLAAALCGLASICPPTAVWGQSAAARFEIGDAQVEAAMQRAALPVDEAQVKLGARMTASTPNAAVEVDAVSLNGPHGLRLRLVCDDRSACLPFFATATYPASVDAAKLLADRSKQVGSAGDAKGGHEPAVEGASAKRTTSGAAQILRAGAPAMLELDADRIHIRIEVICLEGGAAGSRIRVTSLDHKQTYKAQVITPALLKGEL